MCAAKTDLEKLGLFKDIGYHIGVRQEPPLICPFNEQAHKGIQFLVPGPKTRSGNDSGYFGHFVRGFEGDGSTDSMARFRREKHADAKNNASPALFQHSSFPPKMRYGLGTYIGTFGGQIQSMSPEVRPKRRYPEPTPFTFKSTKKGCGYQFPDVAINKYPNAMPPEYNSAVDDYKNDNLKDVDMIPFKIGAPKEYFHSNPWYVEDPTPPPPPPVKVPPLFEQPVFKPLNPGKVLGGMKAGCFTPYEKFHIPTPKVSMVEITEPTDLQPESKLLNGPFHSTGDKSHPAFVSIAQLNAHRKINATNYKIL